jgi:hypothetical protein
MQGPLHHNAQTTPAIRSELPRWRQGRGRGQYNTSDETVRKWRNRSDVEQASYCPHRLHTTLSSAQEAVAVKPYRPTLLPLNELLAAVQEFINPAVSRSCVDCCQRRRAVSRRPEVTPATTPPEALKPYPPGFVHVDVDVKYLLRDHDQGTCLFVAIDRAPRWVYLERLPETSARVDRGIVQRVRADAPFKVAGPRTGSHCCARLRPSPPPRPLKGLRPCPSPRPSACTGATTPSSKSPQRALLPRRRHWAPSAASNSPQPTTWSSACARNATLCCASSPTCACPSMLIRSSAISPCPNSSRRVPAPSVPTPGSSASLGRKVP